jgi:hypothetical protein
MKRHEAIRSKLKTFGLAYPEAGSKSPWPEHDDLVVRGAFPSAEGLPLRITCKLPLTGQMALTLPFAVPTGYGLGKSGWITATFPAKDTPPLDLLKDWIDESYRAVAPKKLVAALPPDPRRRPT